ncbi:MAG: hypothetical protein ACLT5U_05945 [Mediterraneibacter gnavus]
MVEKKSEETLGPDYESKFSRNLLKTKELPVKTGARLLDINRTSIYYNGTPVSQEELDCKTIIDRLHTDNPAWGARQMSSQLKMREYKVGSPQSTPLHDRNGD